MRPRVIFWNNQKQRAEYIVKRIVEEELDVVVFQEVFGRKIVKYMRKPLKEAFPYQYGPGKIGFFKFNSGVMVVSKYPIVESMIKRYDTCKGIDCRARKSAVFTTIVKEKKQFQIVGTHLQASNGYFYSLVRTNQMKVIARFSSIYRKERIFQIYMGDFNFI